MLDMNKFMGIGRLASDPELKHTSTGKSVCSLFVAFNSPKKKRTREAGNKYTSFINIEVWGKLGENCAKYLEKGSQVLIEGWLKVNHVKHPTKPKRVFTSIVAEKVNFGPKSNKKEDDGDIFDDEEPETQSEVEESTEGDDDNIPF
jgi:single-strand DNA-binding protein